MRPLVTKRWAFWLVLGAVLGAAILVLRQPTEGDPPVGVLNSPQHESAGATDVPVLVVGGGTATGARPDSHATHQEKWIRGMVVDETDQPVVGASVSASWGSGAQSRLRAVPLLVADEGDTRTDRTGGFELEDRSGPFTLRAQHGSAKSAVREGARTTRGNRLVLLKEAELLGQVRTAQGAGVPDALVRATFWHAQCVAEMLEIVTDRAGMFRFRSLIPAGWDDASPWHGFLEVEAGGYAPRLLKLSPLRAGVSTRRDVIVAHGATVRGRVLQAGSRVGLAGFAVWLVSQEGRVPVFRPGDAPPANPVCPRVVARSFTDESGSFVLHGIPTRPGDEDGDADWEGSLQVLAGRPGYVVAASGALDLPPDGTEIAVDLFSQESVRIVGRAIDEEGLPVGGAVVQVISPSPPSSGAWPAPEVVEEAEFPFAVTDGDGNFVLSAPSGGTEAMVVLEASLDGPRVRRLAQLVRTQLRAGENGVRGSAQVVFPRRRLPFVRMRVVGPGLEPIADALASPMMVEAAVRTDRAGICELVWDAEAGPRQVLVSAQGYGTKQVDVVAEVEEAELVQVQLAEGLSIGGVVVDAAGSRVGGVAVSAFAAGDWPIGLVRDKLRALRARRRGGAMADSEGRFYVDGLPEGHYTLFAQQGEGTRFVGPAGTHLEGAVHGVAAGTAGVRLMLTQ